MSIIATPKELIKQLGRSFSLFDKLHLLEWQKYDEKKMEKVKQLLFFLF